MGKVLLVMGHRNTKHGDPLEEARTPKVVNAVEPVLRAAGHEVHVLQREDGDADPDFTAGDLASVAVRARDLIQANGIQVMIDVHFQGTDNPTSGCFCVFPDAPGDSKQMNTLDVSFASRLATEISNQTGIRRLPLSEPGGLGIMSEHQTGVGEKGGRLGMFGLTVPVRATCVRVVMEHGDIRADQAVIDGAGFLGNVSRAYVRAINAFWPATTGPKPKPESLNGKFTKFPTNRVLHTQASAMERMDHSVSAGLVKKHAKGETVVADGFAHAEAVFGDDRWVHLTNTRWIHSSGIVENPEK